MRGSNRALIKSDKRVRKMYINEIITTIDCTTGKSWRMIDSNARNPTPFNAKTDSTMTDPPSRNPRDTADKDTTGNMALRKECLNKTDRGLSPLALAVRM